MVRISSLIILFKSLICPYFLVKYKDYVYIMKNLDKINYFNILLMLASLGLAIVVPFQLFLFSYAILGPLHYLTEISWLKRHEFFLPHKNDKIILFALVIFLLMGTNIMPDTFSLFKQFSLLALFSVFALSLILIVTHDWQKRIFLLLILPIVFAILFTNNLVVILFTVFLTTLIHVYVFTGAFILVGAIKNKSLSAYLSFAVFILCPILCVLILPSLNNLPPALIAASYQKTFGDLNIHFLQLLANITVPLPDLIHNHYSVLLTRVIAFAYTYHYLNWFSKTSVIKWHTVSHKQLSFITGIWLFSVVLYLVDYTIGYKWLFILSFLHVLLEFPLNHQSFITIGKASYGSFTKFMPKE